MTNKPTQASNTRQNQPWGKYAPVYDALKHLAPYRALMNTVMEASHLQGNHRILDAGCGTGNLLEQVALKYPAVQCFGVDREEEMRLVAAGKLPKASIAYADLDRRLPFDDASFDRVISTNALYPVTNPSKTLSEFRRVLSDEGLLVLTNPIPKHSTWWVLREHCGSTKPLSYWMAESVAEAQLLIAEATDDPELAEALLAVAKSNMSIKDQSSYHYYDQQPLIELAQGSGFKVITAQPVYAGVSVMLTVQKA